MNGIALASIIVAIITATPTILTIISNRRKEKIQKTIEKLENSINENRKYNNFLMKVVFEFIEILDGKKINGQIKELRKEAQKFNIQN